jgi:hypothetical protein
VGLWSVGQDATRACPGTVVGQNELICASVRFAYEKQCTSLVPFEYVHAPDVPPAAGWAAAVVGPPPDGTAVAPAGGGAPALPAEEV